MISWLINKIQRWRYRNPTIIHIDGSISVSGNVRGIHFIGGDVNIDFGTDISYCYFEGVVLNDVYSTVTLHGKFKSEDTEKFLWK